MSYTRTFCRTMVALAAPGFIAGFSCRALGQSSPASPANASAPALRLSSGTPASSDSLLHRILRGNWEKASAGLFSSAPGTWQGNRAPLLAALATDSRTTGRMDSNLHPGVVATDTEDDVESRGASMPAGRGGDVARIPALVGLQLSRLGATGLIRTPNAEVTEDGDLRLEGFPHTRKGTQGQTYPLVGDSNTLSGTVGFLPNVELGITAGDSTQQKDLTGNVKWQFLSENAQRPALAIGIAEINKSGGAHAATKYPANTYGVASKSFLNGELNLSLGIRNQHNTRPFGGLEVGLGKYASAMIEDDGSQVNYGLRTGLLHEHIQASVEYIDSGWTVQGGVRFTLRSGGNVNNTGTVTLTNPGAGLSDTEAVKTIQTHLVALGLENVDVRIMAGNGAALAVAYENRSYTHNEMDALANVLATMASYAPSHTGTLTVVVKRADLPILHISCPIAEYRDFMSGQIDTKKFAQEFDVDHDTAAPLFSTTGTISADTGSGSKSYGKSDLLIGPKLNTLIETETGPLQVGLDAQVELVTPLTRGIGTDIRADIPLVGKLQGPYTTIDRAALTVATKVSQSFYADAALGRFPGNEQGGFFEGVWVGDATPLLVRGYAGLVTRSDGEPQDPTFLAEGRYYLPYADANLYVTGGKYLLGDTGFTGGVLRRFGNTEIGVEYRDTNHGRVAALTIGLPLGPDHLGYRPSAIRVRPADFFENTQTSSVQRPNYVQVATSTGNQLDVGSDATRYLLDRDRLHRAYLLRSLALLRRVRPLP